jgi:hypothetical protein
MLTRRRLIAEHMDDPAAQRDDLDRSLRFIRMVNARLGGAAAALRWLRCWSAAWDPGETIRIIDLGTGSADIPLAIVRWAERAGRRVHITAIDRHPTTLALAREHIGDCSAITLLQTDALRLADQSRPGEFHIAHAGMFLHHLPDIEVVTALRIMDRLAARGVIWNDLVRGGLERLFIRLATVGASRLLRHDAVASVDNGFTRAEALDLAARAGWGKTSYRRHVFGRFTLVSAKPSPG